MNKSNTNNKIKKLKLKLIIFWQKINKFKMIKIFKILIWHKIMIYKILIMKTNFKFSIMIKTVKNN